LVLIAPHNACLPCKHRSLRAVFQMQLSWNAADGCYHSAFTDDERLCDLGIGFPRRNQEQIRNRARAHGREAASNGFEQPARESDLLSSAPLASRRSKTDVELAPRALNARKKREGRRWVMPQKIVTVTPAGRKRYLEILTPYLLQNRAHIAEHHFWVNTTDAADIAYIESLAASQPDFFKLKRRAVFDNDRQCDSIWQYFQDYTDADTIYIRLDDDICYIAPDAIPTLAAFRAAHREPFLIYGNIVNNAICSYYQQQRGFLPRAWGRVGNECMDAVGWNSKRFAQRLHEKFLADIRQGTMARWKFPPQTLDDYRRFSINVICWYGHDLRDVPELSIVNLYVQRLTHPTRGTEVYDEESMLSEYLPAKFQRPNRICGDALFGHFAFYPQRRYLETMTTLRDEYRQLVYPQSGLAFEMRRRLQRAVKPLNALLSPYAWAWARRRVKDRFA